MMNAADEQGKEAKFCYYFINIIGSYRDKRIDLSINSKTISKRVNLTFALHQMILSNCLKLNTFGNRELSDDWNSQIEVYSVNISCIKNWSVVNVKNWSKFQKPSDENESNMKQIWNNYKNVVVASV